MTDEQYISGVMDGSIVSGELIRLAVERHIADLGRQMETGLTYDTRAAARAVKFIERLRHTKGQWAGDPLLLEGWQKFIVGSIFGWKRPDGTRRFRRAYIEVARKNGKTTLAAGISLYMLYADGEQRAEVYSVAAVRDQAKICFSDAKQAVIGSDLSKRVKVWSNSLTYEPTASTYKALSSDAGIHDGYSPSCVIVDEYHAHPNNDMYDVMVSGTGARKQPLMFIITTAGFNKNYPCYAFRQNALNVLRGITEDDSLFVAIFTMDDGDAWDDPKNWIKANPNLGVSVFEDYIAEQVADAKNRPEAVRNVKTKHLNMWVDAETTWILDEKWMLCTGDTPVEDLDGCTCWGGLDLSNVSDITAFALVFNENDRYQVLTFFWIPEDSLQDKIRNSNASFGAWVDRGFVTVTPGNVTDYDFVERDILRICEKYDVRGIAYDRWNSSQAVIHLQEEGLEMSPFGQGYGSMSAPTKELERLALTQQLEHFGNPVLRWMIASVAISTDPAGNIKPDKSKSSQKIDGVVAVIEAVGQMLTEMADDDKNPYASRGMLSFNDD
ncbi:MAG: terminase large subunit [Bacteroidales bacterium]|nr:terminase large subunit [Bacteroidales bacterium]MBP5689283.1 terminase large subunit [Bacteroidales bacterium]